MSKGQKEKIGVREGDKGLVGRKQVRQQGKVR